MLAILRNELKSNLKSLLIWSLAVGGMGLFCILLYQSMEESMADMAEQFSSMGAFSDAFGMSSISIATLEGFFAAEVGTLHAIGGSMFAAMLATIVLSKEEDGHTAEFTYTLPFRRGKIVWVKLLSTILTILLFQVLCAALYAVGFLALGKSFPVREFLLFMLMQFAMNLEIAAICFFISAISKKNRLGLGMAVALFLYAFDLITRAVPEMKDAILLTPFSYCNAASIFSHSEANLASIVLGVIVFAAMNVAAYVTYTRRDLAG